MCVCVCVHVRDSSTLKGIPPMKTTSVSQPLDCSPRNDDSVCKQMCLLPGGKVILLGDGGRGERWCAIFEQDATECRKQWCLKHHDSTLEFSNACSEHDTLTHTENTAFSTTVNKTSF